MIIRVDSERAERTVVLSVFGVLITSHAKSLTCSLSFEPSWEQMTEIDGGCVFRDAVEVFLFPGLAENLCVSGCGVGAGGSGKQKIKSRVGSGGGFGVPVIDKTRPGCHVTTAASAEVK